MSSKYEIMVAEEPWEKFWTYVDLCDGEVAAFGYAEPQTDQAGGYLYVTDLFLVPQEVSSGGVDVMKDGMPFAVEKAAQDNKLDQLRFCVHSHGNMSTFFSGTDKEMVEKIKKYAPDLPWFASAVFNRKHETYAQVDLWYDTTPLPGVPNHIKAEADIFCETRLEGIEKAKADLEKFVIEKKFHVKATKGKKGKKLAGGSHKHKKHRKHTRDRRAQWDDTEYDANIRREAMEKGWEYIETTDGMLHFYDPKVNQFMGQACEPEEYSDEWLDYLLDDDNKF